MISVGPVHQNIHTYTKTFVPVYDFRPSHLSRLRQRIESMSWNNICEEGIVTFVFLIGACFYIKDWLILGKYF